MRKLQSIVLVLCLIFAVFVFVPTVKADTLDQYYIPTGQPTTNYLIYFPSKYAQSFTPTMSLLTKIQLELCRSTGATGNVELKVWDSITYPANLIVEKTISVSSLSTSWEWIEFDFSDVSVISGNQYYIFVGLSETQVDPNFVGWKSDGGDSYPGGTGYFCDGMNTYQIGYDLAFKTYGENDPPNTPTKPSGTENGHVDTPYTYISTTSDPNNDQIYYWFSWGDGTNSGWKGPYNSGQEGSATKTWNNPGSYQVKVKAKDSNGDESGWSDILYVTMINDPPYNPNKPNGPTSGYHSISYDYSSSSTDPENQQVKIYFDWGDGSGVWTDYVNSGQSVSKSHSWNSPGTYYLRAKAKDIHGAESSWSQSLIITLSNQAPNTPNNPNPNDGATWVETSTSLSWDGGDPNGDTVYYDVYFGTENPPLKVIDGQISTNYDPPGDLEVLTTYYWQIIAEDEYGDQSTGPVWTFTTREYNKPVLTKYDGWQTGHTPDSGTQQTDFTFCVHYEDIDGDPPIVKKVMFDNGKEFEMNLFNGNSYNGDYKAVIKGSSIGGGQHEYWFYYEDVYHSVRFPTPGNEWAVTINHKPNQPILRGQSKGVPDTSYTFSAETTDPEGEDIRYFFDWGDDTNSGWVPADYWLASGDSISRDHSWSKMRTYNVKVKAMDRSGDVSDWSDPIPIQIPRNRNYKNEIINRILIKLSILFPIIEKILGNIN